MQRQYELACGTERLLTNVRTQSQYMACRPPPNNTEWKLLALPARLGGIALANPTQASCKH